MLNGIYKLADGISRASKRIENVSGKALELATVVLFAVLHFVMTAFHEPWFDEAVSWQIARCATVSDILFKVPHYEGHPQLWHLILVPFAKLGLPYELSLAVVTLLFVGGAVVLLVYKSPFPRVIRCLLPFTYFIFYQYGVIARAYCVMLFVFVCLAIVYPKRNVSPGRYAIALAALCGTSAFGIVMAGGIALAWLIEIWEEKKWDKRICWLTVLFCVALFFVISVFPADDTFATNLVIDPKERNPFWLRLFYMVFASLSDVLLTDAYGEYSLLVTAKFDFVAILMAGILGALLLVLIFCYGKRKKTAFMFFLPYLSFGTFAAIVYMNVHHLGIVQFLFLFWVWISLDKTEERGKVSWLEAIPEVARRRGLALGTCLCMCIMLGWNLSACFQEIEKEYAVGRSLSGYIAEHELDHYKIMTSWRCLYDAEDSTRVISVDTNCCTLAMDIAPYFQDNIIYNFAEGKQEGNYISHKVPTDEENEQNYAKWRALGKPDVLLMYPDFSSVWPDGEVTAKDYVSVYSVRADQIWKMVSENTYVHLYVRRELAEELGLYTDVGNE